MPNVRTIRRVGCLRIGLDISTAKALDNDTELGLHYPRRSPRLVLCYPKGSPRLFKTRHYIDVKIKDV